MLNSIPFADIWYTAEKIAYIRDKETPFALVPFETDDMEDFPADGVFFIGPFIPDYLLNEAPEPQNLLEQNDEEAFIRGYQAALSQFDSFIYEQRRRFNKPGELAEAMVNTKGAMLY